MVRCSANRGQTRYDAECVNAREALNIIAAREERQRQAELEAQSEKKRRALRRTLDARAEARKRAAEQERLREEAAYLAQFGELPPAAVTEEDDDISGNAPKAVLPTGPVEEKPVVGRPMPSPVDGGNAPGVTVAPEEPEEPEEPEQSDLSQIREELRNRQQPD